jgi:hypothetical protein
MEAAIIPPDRLLLKRPMQAGDPTGSRDVGVLEGERHTESFSSKFVAEGSSLSRVEVQCIA